MAKMTKAEMDAFKKKNFDLTKKVTEAQLNKLRAEKTPEKAIAKYKNDPAMREALNRFYGKTRVGNVTATPSSSLPKGKGPGNTRPKPPMGKGPGNTRKPSSSTAKPVGSVSTGKALGAVGAVAGGAVGVAAIAAKKMDKKDVANAKAAAGKHRKTPSGPKHAGPKANPRAEVSKYVKKSTAKRAAAKQGVTNKMKAQGTKIMSSAGSRYNQARRGK
jgi:hypothetical protein